MATATVARFVERAARVYEHRPEGRDPSGLGAYATRWLTWVTAGVGAGPRFHDAKLPAASTIDGTLIVAEEHGSEPYPATAGERRLDLLSALANTGVEEILPGTGVAKATGAASGTISRRHDPPAGASHRSVDQSTRNRLHRNRSWLAIGT